MYLGMLLGERNEHFLLNPRNGTQASSPARSLMMQKIMQAQLGAAFLKVMHFVLFGSSWFALKALIIKDGSGVVCSLVAQNGS